MFLVKYIYFRVLYHKIVNAKYVAGIPLWKFVCENIILILNNYGIQ